MVWPLCTVLGFEAQALLGKGVRHYFPIVSHESTHHLTLSWRGRGRQSGRKNQWQRVGCFVLKSANMRWKDPSWKARKAIATQEKRHAPFSIHLWNFRSGPWGLKTLFRFSLRHVVISKDCGWVSVFSPQEKFYNSNFNLQTGITSCLH